MGVGNSAFDENMAANSRVLYSHLPTSQTARANGACLTRLFWDLCRILLPPGLKKNVFESVLSMIKVFKDYKSSFSLKLYRITGEK